MESKGRQCWSRISHNMGTVLSLDQLKYTMKCIQLLYRLENKLQIIAILTEQIVNYSHF